jgi:cyclophilin family peptidyl-prolyl cis-trans isomerase
MYSLRLSLLLIVLLVLAACGTPTDNTAASGATGATENEASPATDEVTPVADEGASADTAARNNKYDAPPPITIDPDKNYTATIETTAGTMKAELFAEEAPVTVNNFVFLARENFYDNVRFHRIIKDFMVQTGDPLGTGTGGPGYRFEDEPVTRPYELGTLAMANAGPDTNGSQFFIVNTERAPLEPNYTIFGQVTEGLDVLEKISATPVEANPSNPREASSPTEDVLITDITIEEH